MNDSCSDLGGPLGADDGSVSENDGKVADEDEQEAAVIRGPDSIPVLLSSSGGAAGMPGPGGVVTKRSHWLRRSAIQADESEGGQETADASDDESCLNTVENIFADELQLAPPPGFSGDRQPAEASEATETHPGTAASRRYTLRKPSPFYPLSSPPAGRGAQHSHAGDSAASNNDQAGDSSLWEVDFRLLCTRHKLRCAGVLNVQTDIKEAAFWDRGHLGFDSKPILRMRARELGLQRDLEPSVSGAALGGRGHPGYIVAGSDCGQAMVFHRGSGLLIAALRDDDHVTNTERPHPFFPLLASSGIDDTIRLWAPRVWTADASSDLDNVRVSGNAPRSNPSMCTATVAAVASPGTQGHLTATDADADTLNDLIDFNLRRCKAAVEGRGAGSGLELPSLLLSRLMSRLLGRQFDVGESSENN